MSRPRNTAESFWAKAVRGIGDECWLWLAGRDKDGYGKIRINGKHRRAHCVAWELSNGKEIPIGMLVLHSCDNPKCINPAHLSIGSQQQNVDDRTARDRFPRGEKNHNAKLTNEQADYARHLYFAERHTHKALAEFFQVSESVISNIVLGRRYRRASWQATAVI